MKPYQIVISLWLLSFWSAALADNLVTNGGFESGLTQWRPFWSRETGAGSVSTDHQVMRTGSASACIEHRGTNDWSFEPDLRIPVQPGDIFQLEAWVKLE